ncbi:phosphatidylethanolamine N-methyltransferase-like [Mya arenaria]|uniref:phosphatidylethanolamine N-methyltransferase-like n=1 Tax=Mya arenaria TaxID=6604 RepID=UPI0022E89A9D|nr:phosphatidylethanolamine N-methyltransferase-like [Mya arenaria]
MLREYQKDCCSGYIDFSKATIPKMEVDLADWNLWLSFATIIFNPLYWNIAARWEYRSHSFSRLIRNKYVACFLLGASIFILGIYRDMRFNYALDSQPRCYILQQNWLLWSGYFCMLVGTTLVVTSYYRLGFYGTFLGDYFGILMEEKVNSFPFSIIDNPMYWGSFLNFLGGALIKASLAGVILSLVVGVCYTIATMFEGPFTSMIYEERNRKLNKMA